VDLGSAAGQNVSGSPASAPSHPAGVSGGVGGQANFEDESAGASLRPPAPAVQPDEAPRQGHHVELEARVEAPSVSYAYPSELGALDEQSATASSSPAAEAWPEDIWEAGGVASSAIRQGQHSPVQDRGDDNFSWGQPGTDRDASTGTDDSVIADPDRWSAVIPGSYASNDADPAAASDSVPVREEEPLAGVAGRGQGVLDMWQPPEGAPALMAGDQQERGMSAAQALEELAAKIRSGELAVPGYEPGMSDAAALTAALAAVLGIRR